MTSRMRERRNSDVALGNGGLTIEDIIRDMLKPLLREWLDANLPTMVERLVHEEIKRISREAL
jgi:cell pole-organizing protein PopZ